MTKKLDKARFYRNGYEAMRKALMKDIVAVLKEDDDNELHLDDEHGSLVCGGDDQESQIIHSIWLQYPDKVIAKVGVYEPDYDMPLDEMDIELVLNIMDAVEVAVNDPE